MSILPYDLKLKVLHFLGPVDVMNAGIANKGFYSASKDNTLWKKDLKITIQNFTDRIIDKEFPQQMERVRYMNTLRWDQSSESLQRTDLARQVTFISYQANFDEQEFQCKEISKPGDTIAEMLDPKVLPDNECRFVSFSCGTDRKHRLMWWEPSKSTERKRDFFRIHWTALIERQMDPKILVTAGTIQDLLEKLDSAMPAEVKEQADAYRSKVAR